METDTYPSRYSQNVYPTTEIFTFIVFRVCKIECELKDMLWKHVLFCFICFILLVKKDLQEIPLLIFKFPKSGSFILMIKSAMSWSLLFLSHNPSSHLQLHFILL